MRAWITALVPVFLIGQGALVYWIAGTEQPPRPPALSQFPASFDRWLLRREDPIDADIADTLRADGLLSRTYFDTAGDSAQLLVAWFQSQRAGTSQPHSPKVCLPAAGWTPESTGDLTLVTSAGTITVNRYVVANRGERAVVLYWYQARRRVVAGEWASKLWLMADSIRDRRTDTSLVRIVVESQKANDARATQTAADFARAAYPVLVHHLPG